MFPDQLRWLLLAMGGSEITMLLHRIFAVILIFSLAYFGTYFILERIKEGRGDSNIKNFGFSLSFLKEVFGGAVKDVLWAIGIVKERPKFGKYDWIMVADIYGLPLLAIVQVITGIVMWLPRDFIWIFARIFGIPENPALFFIARNIHAAVSFFLLMAIIAHTTILHFTPGRFPVDTTIFSGFIPKERAVVEFENWKPKEEITIEKAERKIGSACYIFGIILILEIIALATIPYFMYNEFLVGLRVKQSSIAFIALSFAELLILYYIFLTIVTAIRAVSFKHH